MLCLSFLPVPARRGFSPVGHRFKQAENEKMLAKNPLGETLKAGRTALVLATGFGGDSIFDDVNVIMMK